MYCRGYLNEILDFLRLVPENCPASTNANFEELLSIWTLFLLNRRAQFACLCLALYQSKDWECVVQTTRCMTLYQTQEWYKLPIVPDTEDSTEFEVY